MTPITLSREDWRAVIAVLRAKQLPYIREHADYIERLLERHAPDEPMVALYLTDDVSLRSSNGAARARHPAAADGAVTIDGAAVRGEQARKRCG